MTHFASNDTTSSETSDLSPLIRNFASEFYWRSTLDGDHWLSIDVAAEQVYRRSVAELLAQPELRWQAIAEEDCELVRQKYNRLRNESVETYEYRIRDSRGEEHWIKESICQVHGDDGRKYALCEWENWCSGWIFKRPSL